MIDQTADVNAYGPLEVLVMRDQMNDPNFIRRAKTYQQGLGCTTDQAMQLAVDDWWEERGVSYGT